MRTIEFSIEWSNSATAVKVILKPPPHTVLYQRPWSYYNSHRMSTHTGAGGSINTTSARRGLSNLSEGKYSSMSSPYHFSMYLFKSVGQYQVDKFMCMHTMLFEQNLILLFKVIETADQMGVPFDPAALYWLNYIFVSHFVFSHSSVQRGWRCGNGLLTSKY